MVLVNQSQIYFQLSEFTRIYEAILESISQDPILFGLIILLIILITIYVARKIARYLHHPSDDLASLIDESEHLTVLMHENPDPDAMASAMGIERIANKYDTDTQIAYPGRISHHENRAFRAVLDVSFDCINHVSEITGDTVILVDHYVPRGVEDGDTLIVDGVVDHHTVNGYPNTKDTTEFWYVEDKVGSCSTIVTEFLYELDIISEENGISKETATALYFGIKSDTNDMSKGVHDRDFKALTKLYRLKDDDMLHRIANPKVDKEALETRARAIMGREVRGSFAVSDVGEVQNPDAIPQASDELIQLEGLSAVIVIGTYNGDIRMSGRAYDDRVHLGNALSELANSIPGSEAGGHSEMAGGVIPLDTLETNNITRTDIIEDLFDVLNGR